MSLASWVEILENYELVACNENGVNAFFVKSKHAKQFADIPKQIEKIYRTASRAYYPGAGKPTTPHMVQHLAE